MLVRLQKVIASSGLASRRKAEVMIEQGRVTVNGEVVRERGTRVDQAREDGVTSPARVKKVRKAEQNSWLEITIHEGRKHQVKRMLEAVGHPVSKLIRVRFGPLTLRDLAAGEFRYLTDREANAVRDLVRDRTSSETREQHHSARNKARVSSRLTRREPPSRASVSSDLGRA